jgi:hypothetical protein
VVGEQLRNRTRTLLSEPLLTMLRSFAWVATIPEGRERWTLGGRRRESLGRRPGRGFWSIACADHDLRGRSVDAAPRFCRLTRRRKELISRNFVKPSNGLECSILGRQGSREGLPWPVG